MTPDGQGYCINNKQCIDGQACAHRERCFCRAGGVGHPVEPDPSHPSPCDPSNQHPGPTSQPHTTTTPSHNRTTSPAPPASPTPSSRRSSSCSAKSAGPGCTGARLAGQSTRSASTGRWSTPTPGATMAAPWPSWTRGQSSNPCPACGSGTLRLTAPRSASTLAARPRASTRGAPARHAPPARAWPDGSSGPVADERRVRRRGRQGRGAEGRAGRRTTQTPPTQTLCAPAACRAPPPHV